MSYLHRVKVYNQELKLFKSDNYKRKLVYMVFIVMYLLDASITHLALKYGYGSQESNFFIKAMYYNDILLYWGLIIGVLILCMGFFKYLVGKSHEWKILFIQIILKLIN